MFKNKLNYKLLNMLLFIGIIYLFYQTNGLWITVGNKVVKILFPFLIAFAIAYALYPIVRYLQNKKIPKNISVFITIFLVIGLIAFIGITIVPMLFDQLGSLFNAIIAFIKEMSMKYDIDFGPLQNMLTKTFNSFLKDISLFISNGALSFIGASFSYISTTIIIFASAIYLLVDMENIRNKIKIYFKNKSKKTYNYVKALDLSMKNYLDGFTKIIFITIIEYTITFAIIGHPNAILLGFLAALGNLIPYFGGLITNIIASITAFVISPSLFIRTLVAFLVLSAVDSYIINPYVYGRTNELHPIMVIFSVFAGGILFGLIGIMISLPVTILIITTINYYKKDMKNKFNELREM